MKSRLKVLVNAYACNPRQGSEEGVGWGWVRAIAEHHDLWVITDEVHRPDIERAFEEQPDLRDCLSFHYVRRKRWKVLETLWPPSYFWTYRRWLWDAFRIGQRLHQTVRFDVAHQLTFVTFRAPGYLWRLDIPFVWGPIGGLEDTPWRFLPLLGVKGCLHFAARNIVNSLHKRFLREPKLAFRKARGGIIAATGGIQREIYRCYREQSHILSEVGPPAVQARSPSCRDAGEPLRLSWSGLHFPGKALPLLLHALTLLPRDVDWRLEILGSGPCTGGWRRLAIQLGLDDRCRWHGQLARDRAIAVVGNSHVFVITSMKDLTSTVILEALSQGVPVICPDHCGFSEVIDVQSGIKIPLDNPRQLKADLAKAIERLAGNESERRRLARGALCRIEDFSWQKKAETVDRIYRSMVANPPGTGDTSPRHD